VLLQASCLPALLPARGVPRQRPAPPPLLLPRPRRWALAAQPVPGKPAQAVLARTLARRLLLLLPPLLPPPLVWQLAR
jgi:hypothetical protein